MARMHTKKKKEKSSSKGKGKFSYNRSPDSVRKRAQQSGSNRDSFISDKYKTFRPADGQNHIRILPPSWEDAEHFAYDAFVNYGIGSDESAFLSLSAMLGEDDPIAEERQRAEKEGDVEYADTLKPVKRPLCFIIDKSAKKREQTPLIWPMPWTFDRDIAVLMTDKRSGEVLPIDDLEEGYDIFFEKTGKGLKTRYQGLEIDRESSPAVDDDDKMEEIEEFLLENPLPECLVFHDYDHIAKVFSGGGKPAKRSSKGASEPSWEDIHEMDFEALEALIEEQDLDIDSEDFDEEEELADQICDELGIKKSKKGKASKKSSSSKLRKMREEEEDDDSDDDDDDDDDEEDDSDDDEDDDEDEDEDEEEKPRRRRTSTKKDRSKPKRSAKRKRR